VGVDVVLLARQWIVPVVVAVPAAMACHWASAAVSGPPIVAILVGTLTAVLTFALPLSRRFVRSLAELRAAAPTATPLKGD
jgi:hypothetical protein